MKFKILTLIGFILFIGPIIAIFGIAGASDCGDISLKQVAIRGGIALAVLAADTVLVSYLQKKAPEETAISGRAHK